MTKKRAPRRTDASLALTRTPVHRRLTWRDVLAGLAMAAAMPALVWAVSSPAQALTVATAVAVAGTALRTAKRRSTTARRSVRAAVSRLVRRGQ